MQDWEQADDTSNRILTSSADGNSTEATKFKVLQLICRRGQVRIRTNRRYDTQPNYIKHNDTQPDYIKNTDTQYNDTQHSGRALLG
jgi:hypothetical protein